MFCRFWVQRRVNKASNTTSPAVCRVHEHTSDPLPSANMTPIRSNRAVEPRAKIHVLGSLGVTSPTGFDVTPRAKKAHALLGYVALSPGQRRDHLIRLGLAKRKVGKKAGAAPAVARGASRGRVTSMRTL